MVSLATALSLVINQFSVLTNETKKTVISIKGTLLKYLSEIIKLRKGIQKKSGSLMNRSERLKVIQKSGDSN